MSTFKDPAVFGEEISTSSKKPKHHSDDRLTPTFHQLLEELLYEVFLRLPVKSLFQFRCVSKGIRRMIDNPIFIKNHNIHRSVISERDKEYAIFLYQPGFHGLFSLSFDKDDNNNNNNLNRGKAIKLNSTFLKEQGMKECRIPMGLCCNGIFCFKSRHPADPQSYVLWNPSNDTFRKVDCSSSRIFSPNVSMGYDCVNDDYKIIGFIIGTINETSLEVYSFRKDSWRKIPGDDFPPGHSYLEIAVCVSGVMHWLWTNRIEKSVFIAAFDLATETFTSLPLPLEARQQRQIQPPHLTDFRGRLCVTFFPLRYRGRFHVPQTIWVMEKYGVESSWSKLYNFDSTRSCFRNFYFPNMKRRSLCSNYSWLSWWDPQDGSFEDIEIPGLLNDQALFPELYYYEAYVYVRNLVRLDQSWKPR